MKCYFYNTLNSTMAKAQDLLQAAGYSFNEPFAVVARVQVNGKGKGERTWLQSTALTPPNSEGLAKQDGHEFSSLPEALAFEDDFCPITCVFPRQAIQIPPEWITLAVGAAVFDATQELIKVIKNRLIKVNFSADFALKKFLLKWPNDLIVMDSEFSCKKISGILCEANFIDASRGSINIGIGYNLFSSPALDIATNLWEVLFGSDEYSKNEKNTIRKQKANLDFRQHIVASFAELLVKELYQYLTVKRTLVQLNNLILERMFEVGTGLIIDNGFKRYGNFAGLSPNAALLVDGIDAPLVNADISIKGKLLVKNLLSPISKKIVKVEPTKVFSKVQTCAVKENCVLALDIGNTRLHWQLMLGDNYCSSGHVESSKLLAFKANDLAIIFKELREDFAKIRVNKVFLMHASVAHPEITRDVVLVIETFLKNNFPAADLIKQEINSSIILNFLTSNQQYVSTDLGTDRALRFYYAQELAKVRKNNIAIFSIGTAFTCEVVDSKLNIVDSLIGPGIDMSLRALHQGTAKLPDIAFDSSDVGEFFGTWSTTVSMRRGVIFGIIGAIKEIVAKHGVSYVVLCGGNAQVIYDVLHEQNPSFSIDMVIEPNLETKIICKFAASYMAEGGLAGFNVNEKSVKSIFESMSRMPKRREISEPCQPKISLANFRSLGIRIETGLVNMRLDLYLASTFKFHTREEWRRLVLNREVFIESNAAVAHKDEPENILYVKPTYKTKLYDQLWLYHPSDHEPDHIATCEILEDDGDVVVFTKPGNLVIHAVGQYRQNTFLNVIKNMGYASAAPVHRIDRETSGLLVCARSTPVRRIISDAFRDGLMKKMYFAVCKLRRDSLPDTFRVNLPIGDAVDSKIRLKLWVGGANQMTALTDFKLLSQVDSYALLACFPRTGRTNQIRVHLAAIGAWIVGDKLYYPEESIFLEYYENGLNEKILNAVEFPRHLLHNIAIQGPTGNFPQVLTKPVVSPIPEDFMAFKKTSELLLKANIPMEFEAQKKYIEQLSISWFDDKFVDSPTVPQYS